MYSDSRFKVIILGYVKMVYEGEMLRQHTVVFRRGKQKKDTGDIDDKELSHFGAFFLENNEGSSSEFSVALRFEFLQTWNKKQVRYFRTILYLQYIE